jgi:hypothetical protein
MKDQRRCQRPLLVYLGFLFLGLSFPTLIHPALAQQVFKTQSATIYYEDPASLREMEHRLRFSQASRFSQSYFYTQDPVQAALSPGLAAKIDGLLAKVCLLLNKSPKQAQGLNIFILKDGKQVRQRHLVFLPRQNGAPAWFGYGRLEAFYEPVSRTIFLSLEDLHAGILAHELTHFVLCESFAVPPPAALQEDWGRYVESSLD